MLVGTFQLMFPKVGERAKGLEMCHLTLKERKRRES